MGSAILKEEELELLRKTRDILEEILETLEIMANKELLKEIEESRGAAGRGLTKSFRELVGELGLEEEV